MHNLNLPVRLIFVNLILSVYYTCTLLNNDKYADAYLDAPDHDNVVG